MPWDDSLTAMFENLEQQAAGLALEERDVEVADRAQAEYLRVTLVSRWVASVGCDVRLVLPGLGRLSGRIARVGFDWCLLESAVERPWVIRLPAVESVNGLSDRSVHEDAWPVTTRLGIGSLLRRLGEEAASLEANLLGGGHEIGRLRRVGADFVELATAQGITLVPFGAVVACRPCDPAATL